MGWIARTAKTLITQPVVEILARFGTKAYGPVVGLDNGLPIVKNRSVFCSEIGFTEFCVSQVALVGRPNVGKSVLYNRLIKRKDAIVKNTPDSHVTRDYRSGIALLGELTFTLVDTSGLEPAMTPSSIQRRATAITEKLMKRVDLVLLMIDARETLTYADQDVASWLLKMLPRNAQTLLVANKCESLATGYNVRSESAHPKKGVEDTLAESHRLGIGDPICISAETGDGMIHLCEALIPLLTPSTRTDVRVEPIGTDQEPIKVAIMGLPNVGKSTLMNALVQYERSLTGPEEGLTRDPVSEVLYFQDKKIHLIDTAGWTKFFAYEKLKTMDGKLAKEAYYAARKILLMSHIVMVMIDATSFEAQETIMLRRELQLASEVLKEKRVLMIIINKIDKLTEEQRKQLQTKILEALSNRFFDVDDVACLAVSAETGDGIEQLMPQIIQKADKWSSRLKTSSLNNWFEEMAAVQRLARFTSTGLKRIKFISQTKIRPPSFCLRVTGRKPITHVEKRTFVKAMRKAFDFRGVPVRLEIKYNTSWSEAKEQLRYRDRAVAARS